jgi:hypothetical protein
MPFWLLTTKDASSGNNSTHVTAFAFLCVLPQYKKHNTLGADNMSFVIIITA